MRTYGRVIVDGIPEWRVVETTLDGRDDLVWLTTLAQVLKLNLNESPFYADYGIPAKQAVVQQVFPDFYVTRTQQRFASKFGSLIVAKVQDPTPMYRLNVTTHQGVDISAEVPV